VSVQADSAHPGEGGVRRGAAAVGAAQRRYPLAQILALVAIFVYGQATIDGFDSRQSIDSMLVLAAFLGIAAIGQTLVLLIGGIDFSIPAFIVAGATITIQLTSIDHWAFVPTIVVIVVIAAVCGGASGYISHRFRIQPLIVTLGVGSVVSGGILVWSNGVIDGSPPMWLSRLTSPATKTLGVGLPPVVVVWAILALIIGVVLHRSVAGRWVYMTGSNPRAADFSMVPTRRIWIGAFALSAVAAACVGVLLAGFSGSGESSIGDPYLYESLTAVVVGGTAFGARGDYWRTVLGALILTELSTVLVGHGYSTADQQILSGILILIVVALYGRDRRLRDRI
jgi:ribose transport system permease protein